MPELTQAIGTGRRIRRSAAVRIPRYPGEVDDAVGNTLAAFPLPTSGGASGGNLLNSALGQASYKRQYAAEFGVDPYTSYEPLQKALTDLSWTAAAGGLTVKAAFIAIPGGAGWANPR